MTDAEINQEFTRKIERGIFRPVARHLTNFASAEDRLQDAICQVWLMYRRYIVEKGKILDDAVLVQKCRWSACDLGRSFVGAGGRKRKGDVLDPRSFRDGRVQVLRLEGVSDEQSSDGDRDLQVGYAEYMANNPARKIRSAIDLERWVGDLSGIDQFVMCEKYRGCSTAEIAAALSMPYGQVYARTKQKGLELAQRAGIRIGGRKARRKNKGDIDAAMKQADDAAAYGG